MRICLEDVFLGNELSSQKVNFMAQACQDAGLDHMRDLAKASGKSKKDKKNLNRNTLRVMLKNKMAKPVLWFCSCLGQQVDAREVCDPAISSSP